MRALLILALVGADPADAQGAPARVDAAVAKWTAALEATRRAPLPPKASLRDRVLRLVRLDEVVRQYLWVVDDPGLTPAERAAVAERVGPALGEQDAQNSRELQALLPSDGWFRNGRDGRVVTHGAWLIAQHTPDSAFRVKVLARMAERLPTGDVDARDYALTYDRVQIFSGRKQKFGTQARCSSAGTLEIESFEQLDRINAERERIGWAQTFEETLGDLEIGKPCAR